MSFDDTKTNQPHGYVDAGTRPHVQSTTEIKPYRPNDQVYFINEDGEREGPYLVESIAQQGKCTLVEQDGVTPVRSYAVSCKSLIPK